MSRNFLLITTIFIVVIGYIFNLDNIIKNNLSILGNNISSGYINTMVSIESSINKYFNQTSYIEQLKKENKEYTKYKTLYNIAENELHELRNMFHVKHDENLQLQRVKVLSSYTLYEPSIVRFNGNLDIDNAITPIITYDGFSAGILIKKDKYTLGYLNKNPKCNYAVYIGKENAPGITSGMDDEGNLIIKHIPKWKKVYIDDEIITSGMDNIFPYGIKVAKVLNIKKGENTNTIYALPYAHTLGKRYFYIIKNHTDSDPALHNNQ